MECYKIMITKLDSKEEIGEATSTLCWKRWETLGVEHCLCQMFWMYWLVLLSCFFFVIGDGSLGWGRRLDILGDVGYVKTKDSKQDLF